MLVENFSDNKKDSKNKNVEDLGYLKKFWNLWKLFLALHFSH
jgi:hypothetical protein